MHYIHHHRHASDMKAFVLAAGSGARMKDLTKDTPKPLLDVAGKKLIDWTLSHIEQCGLDHIIINTCDDGNEIEPHVKKKFFMNFTFIHEKERLNHGGGVHNALSHFDNRAFFVINGDIIWINDGRPVFTRMADFWDTHEMDVFLLLYPVEKTIATNKTDGDYFMEEDGKLRRRKGGDKPAPYVFTGIRVAHPRLFQCKQPGNYSFVDLMDEAEKRGRLYGLVHNGDWFHIGSPAALEEVDNLLAL
jgi:MurNAc alpha-1-phosphate uridylyltransferase